MRGITPDGTEIVGTLETVTGVAGITFCAPGEKGLEQEGKLSFNWKGNTEIDWNTQRSLLTSGEDAGKRIFVDGNDNQWTEDQITLVMESDEEIEGSYKGKTVDFDSTDAGSSPAPSAT